MRVVVIDVVDHEAFELALVPDDGPVEEFASQGPDPAFSEAVSDRCVDRGFEDLDCGARKLCRPCSGGVSVLVDEPVASARSEHCDGSWWWR